MYSLRKVRSFFCCKDGLTADLGLCHLAFMMKFQSLISCRCALRPPCLFPGDRGNIWRAAQAGLLVWLSRINQRQGERGAENLLCVYRHEQAARYGAELRPSGRSQQDWRETHVHKSRVYRLLHVLLRQTWLYYSCAPVISLNKNAERNCCLTVCGRHIESTLCTRDLSDRSACGMCRFWRDGQYVQSTSFSIHQHISVQWSVTFVLFSVFNLDVVCDRKMCIVLMPNTAVSFLKTSCVL